MTKKKEKRSEIEEKTHLWINSLHAYIIPKRRLQQIPKLGRDRLLMCRDERVELLEVELMSVVLASHGFEATTQVVHSSYHCRDPEPE